MLAQGLVDEVRRALADGVPADAAGLRGVGYREVVEMLAGRLPAAELEEDITVSTRRYAKRQDTWFRHQLEEPVLVLDDDVGMLEQWRIKLEQHRVTALACTSYENFVEQKIPPKLTRTAIIDYHFDNSELNGVEVIQKLKEQGFDNLYLCTAEYWKPSLKKEALDLGVSICPKPLPKIVVTPLLCKEGQGEVDQSLCSTPSNSPLQRGRGEKDGYTVLVIDDDPMIRMSWQMIQKKLEIGKLYSFESLEALKKTDGIDFAALDFAFVDKNIENSAFDGSQVIDFLKAKGVAKVILASGENEDRLRTDPQFAKADFVIGLKVPVSLKQFFS